jgi:ferric-dicitrate binding protein FerR (iron transport regulator)
MMVAKSLRALQKAIALVMVLAISPLSAIAGDNDKQTKEPVGKVTGLTASAYEGSIQAGLKDEVRSKEDLSTNRVGRLRVQLHDGSILSLGSETRLRVVKHDASTGETLVQLSTGRLRNRVVKVRKAGTPYQVETPQARISVVGTDFFVDTNSSRTQIIVYSGIVLVGGTSGTAPVDVAAGQNVTVDRNGVSRLGLTAEDAEHESMAETALPNELAPTKEGTTEVSSVEKPHSHFRRNLLIGAAVAGGALAAGMAARGSGSKSQQPQQPANVPSVPTIPPH